MIYVKGKKVTLTNLICKKIEKNKKTEKKLSGEKETIGIVEEKQKEK